MSSQIGRNIRVQVFGESHGPSIGVIIDGLPAGLAIDDKAIADQMARRAPGQSAQVTQRREPDSPQFLSGLYRGHTTGSPLCAVIANTDTRSKDYAALADLPRPSHADYNATVKYGGYADMRGGGHFSGRLTAPLVLAGAICAGALSQRGIDIGAHLIQVGEVMAPALDPVAVTREDLDRLRQAPLGMADEAARQRVEDLLDDLRRQGDSVGGLVECAAIGLPQGLGEPMAAGVENRLSAALFAIPGLRGLAFGAGFAACAMRGSAHNDPYTLVDGRVQPASNHAGGVLGGITTGLPLISHTAFKPTPSIARPQASVRLSSLSPESLTISGRHDPCIAIRAVPVVEAVTAIVCLDLLFDKGGTYAT